MCTVAALTTRFLAILTVHSQRPQWPSTNGAGAASARAFGILAPLQTQPELARQVAGIRKAAVPTMRSWATLTATSAIEVTDEMP
jgi:hypothetical protein